MPLIPLQSTTMYIMYEYIMKIAIICCGFIAWSEGNNTSTRIVGGRAAVAGQFPYQVAMQWNGRQRCGGAIVNCRTIVTAAHCVVNKSTKSRIPANELQVHAGSIHRYKNGQLVGVQKVLCHPKYNQPRFDVALLLLKTPLTFNNHVRPIPLAKKHVRPGRKLITCGWGAVKLGAAGEEALRYTHVTTVSNKVCFEGRTPIPSIFCCKSPVGRGICRGDSGSAIALRVKNKNVLMGISSYVRGGCGTSNYDAFTRCSLVRGWIVKNAMKCKSQ